MSTLLAFADANDAYITSTSSSYNTALNGSSLSVSSAADTLYVGQRLSGGTYDLYQSFLQHNHAVTTEQTPVAAYIRMVVDSNTGSATARNIEMTDLDFGAEVNTSDWRTLSQLGALWSANPAMTFIGAQNLNSNGVMLLGNSQLQYGVFDEANSPRRYVIYSSKNRIGSAPSSSEITYIRSADYAGTSFDPVNMIGRARTSLIDLCSGAQVQLSDGSTVYCTQDDPAPYSMEIRIWRWDGSTHTELASFPAVTRRSGLQNVALCRDTSDNVYIIVPNNSTTSNNRLAIRGLVKTGATSWTLAANQTFDLPPYSGAVNNLSMAWHPQGSGGTLLVLASSNPGHNSGPSARWALVNAQTVRNGSGLQVRNSGDAEGSLINRDSSSFANSYPNETGTLIDLCAAPGSSRGFVTSATKAVSLAQTGRQSLARYEISSAGSTFAWANNVDTFTGFSLKDSDTKSRLITLNENEFVTANASTSVGFGMVIKHRRNVSGTTFTDLADVRLHSEGITSLPTEGTMAASSNWDIAHSPLDNRVWLYYFDVNDGRRILKTDVSLVTGLAGQNVVEVATNVGPSGSTNVHLRTHRGTSVGDRVLLTVGNRDSGGTHSIVLVEDQLNAAPNAPILTTKQNYDATQDGLFEWDFSDPNAIDSQSAFQMEIYRVSDNTLVVDTGKISTSNEFFTISGGSLTNGLQYQWRVKTWDSEDEEGPYSNFGSFTTSNTGLVNITYPVTDNDPSVITASFLMTWTVTNTTQAQYRVEIYRTSDDSLISDTGWIVSTAMSHQISGLESDIEYRIELRIRDAALVESNTASVLVTPSYNRPEVPVVSVTSFPDAGYIRIDVSNPEPQGDRPNPTSNEVYRREIGSSVSYLVGTTEPNSHINDYEAASRTPYEYWARAGVE